MESISFDVAKQDEFIADQVSVVEDEYLEIEGAAEQSQALDMLRVVRTRIKALENERLTLTRPLDKAKKQIMEKWREPIRKLQEYEQRILAAMNRWKLKLVQDEKAREKQAEEDAKNLEAAGAIEAANAVRLAAQGDDRKAAGERVAYSAEVEDLMALVKAVAEGKAPAHYIAANNVALNKVARERKEAFDVPGCVLRKKTVYV